MFADRKDAGLMLATKLRGRTLYDPLVLAIPRGGVVTGAVLARELNAELDVVLSRKLRAPGNPEVAIGAVGEDGAVYLNDYAEDVLDTMEDYLPRECERQRIEIQRRRQVLRAVRPPANLEGRSVIVTDDGIATGSTMIAALETIRAHQPREIIVAVPVASPSSLEEIRRRCDDVVCVLRPRSLMAVGQYYEDFTQVEDEEVVELLRAFAPQPAPLS